jgi:glycosyltransferase involved in cell wall biosynthesis
MDCLMSARKKIAFVSFNTRFFLTHLMPVVAAARVSDFEIYALLPSIPVDTDLLHDVNIISIGSRRSRHPLLFLVSDLLAVCAALRKTKPDIVQAFSVHACIVLIIASVMVKIKSKLLTITGLGLIDIDDRWSLRLMRTFAYWLFRAADRTRSTTFVFENAEDPKRIGFLDSRPREKLILMGAGVNLHTYPLQAIPPLPPLKLAVVSRMIWSKGVDLAVSAVKRMVDQGMPVELDLYGCPDFENLRYFPVALLNEWGRSRGIRWHGYTTDVVGVWREHHAALFPTRGGEGLPRALLEAAACGRAIIAANVAGCTDFVRPGLEGLLVEPNSIDELCAAIEAILQRPSLLERMGLAARQRVLEHSTEEIIVSQYRDLFGRVMRPSATRRSQHPRNSR